MRDFFTKGPNAPIIVSDYERVTDELVHVLDVLQIINEDAEKISDLGMWLKILKMYSNKFPMFAIVSYLYKYGKDEEYVEFLKLLTRVCYSYGPSTTVKFTIYNIIADIFSEVIKKKKSVDYFMPNLESLSTRYHLKKGLVLLTYYIVVKQPVIGTLSIEKILRPSKTTNVDETIRNLIFQLGNFFIIDKVGDTVENDYNRLFFDFKYKNIKCGDDLLSMVKERTQKLLPILYDFLADKQ